MPDEVTSYKAADIVRPTIVGTTKYITVFVEYYSVIVIGSSCVVWRAGKAVEHCLYTCGSYFEDSTADPAGTSGVNV